MIEMSFFVGKQALQLIKSSFCANVSILFTAPLCPPNFTENDQPRLFCLQSHYNIIFICINVGDDNNKRAVRYPGHEPELVRDQT